MIVVSPPAWLDKLANWLTFRRIRAQAIILVVCLWSVAIVDFSNPSLFDRVGNIKFQDFLVFYISGRLVTQHHSDKLFDAQAQAHEIRDALGRPTPTLLPAVYGPQVALLFSSFSRMRFLSAALTWVLISTVIYSVVCAGIWQSCPTLRGVSSQVALVALAFPPFFHFVVRGQISSLILLCFGVAFFVLQTKRDWLAGLALGSLILKPQFMLGVVIIMLAARAWKIVAGVLLGSLTQIGFSWAYFGTAVMRIYLAALWHLPQAAASLEPGVAQTQMHSLRSFWLLILPEGKISVIFYAISSVIVLYIATKAWRSPGPLALRFSVLLLATVLVNPHLFIYDLLALAPMFLLTANWAIQHPEHSWSKAIKVLLYLAFLLPLCGPLAIWTHLQLSVIVFIGLLVVLTMILQEESADNRK